MRLLGNELFPTFGYSWNIPPKVVNFSRYYYSANSSYTPKTSMCLPGSLGVEEYFELTHLFIEALRWRAVLDWA